MGSLFGGGSSSTVTQTSDTNVVTQDQLDAFNEQVNKNIVKSVVSQAQSSSSGVTQINNTDVGLLVASGHADINLAIKDTQTARVSLKALEKSIQTSKLRNTIANQLAEQLANKTNTNTFNKLVASASASMQSGLFSGLLDPGSSASSDVNTNITTNVTTQQTTNLKNIIKSLVSTNDAVNSYKKCFNNIFQEKNTNIAGAIASGYATINISDITNQLATSETSCSQSTSQVNNITSALTQLMGIKVIQSAATTTKSQSTDTAVSKNVKKGLGDLIDGILGFFKGTLGMIIVAILVICCLGLSGYSVYSKMKSKSATQQQVTQSTDGPGPDDQPSSGDGPGDDLASGSSVPNPDDNPDSGSGDDSDDQSKKGGYYDSSISLPYRFFDLLS